MTRKADFNAEEWSLVLEAPPLAGMMVMVAERGGTIREAVSMSKAYAAAQQQQGGELIGEIVSARPELDPQRYKNPEELRGRGLGRIREAVELLERKASPDEVDAYRRFIVEVATTVANAKKEGGVLGIGGKPVSEEEQKAIDELAAALDAEPSG